MSALPTHAESLGRAQEAAIAVWRERVKPPPVLSVSQWADAYRVLPETSAEPGPWRTLRAPYLRGIMDACSDPETERVVIQKGAQVGYSEVLLNVLGYFVDQDPAPVLLVQISTGEAAKFSKERIAPLLETPRLAARVAPPKSRDSENTIESKRFAGGHLGIVGANAPSGLRSRARRVVLLDEIDGYPPSAGDEGDPVELAVKRTTTFWNRLIVMGSTPTIADLSRIDHEFHATDQRVYLVPCRHCAHLQTLAWERIRWEKADGRHLPDTAVYVCEKCGAESGEGDKRWMLEEALNFGIQGWHPTAEGRPRTAGFLLPATYSPWLTWSEMAEEFLDAKGNPAKLQVFVNTRLAEVWDEATSVVQPESLMARREDYAADPLPAGVEVLTLGVDVQADRLEAEIVGWGVGEESWSIEYLRIPGDPTVVGVWNDLDLVLARTWLHANGVRLRITAACVDAGYQTSQVKKFAADRRGTVMAVKGVAGFGRPILDRPRTQTRGRIPLYPVGVDTAKTVLYARLQIAEPGPGFCHFPSRQPYDGEHFRQLTSERAVMRQTTGGLKRAWVRRPGRRAEVLDARIYATAALEGLLAAGTRIETLAAIHQEIAMEIEAPEPTPMSDDHGGGDWASGGGRWRVR